MREIYNSYFTPEIELLETIRGIKQNTAMRIIAEIGSDMKAFLTASAIVEWAGLKTKNEESAGNIKGKKTLRENKYLRILLIQCTQATCRTKESKFFYKYKLSRKE